MNDKPASDLLRRRVLRRSAAVMALVSLVSIGIAIAMLYRSAVDEHLQALADAAASRAQVVRLLATRTDAQTESGGGTDGALAALSSGSFVLARREGNEIVFLPADGDRGETPASIPWDSQLAEPMRRALRGETGTAVAVDHRGVDVLAAYRPIPDLGVGLVTATDLSEVRAPFVRTSLVAFALSCLLLLAAAVVLERRLVAPLLERIDEKATRITQSILDTTIDAVIRIDVNGRIEAANREAHAMFGYEQDELPGRNVSTLMPEPYSGHHPEFVAAYLETRHAKIIGIGREVPCLRKDGSAFPADLAVSEIRLGDRTFFTGILRDLSALKKSEEHLREVEKRMRAAEELASVGTLVAGLAHEIGTPMGVIQGHARLLEKWITDDQARWRLTTIQEQIARISRIIQSLLNMARPKATERVPVALEPLIETTLSFLSEKLARRDVRIVRDFLPTGSVTGDPERLQQLLLNLFLNAIDAMPEGGQLTVRLRPDGKAGARLDIADTGIGIEPENLERIFDAFYTSKEAGKGNGLGLVVASTIVTDHHGTIEVESAVGRGTEFRVHLPWVPVYPPEGDSPS